MQLVLKIHISERREIDTVSIYSHFSTCNYPDSWNSECCEEEIERDRRGRNVGAREVEKAQHGHGSNTDRTARDNWIFVDFVSPRERRGTARFYSAPAENARWDFVARNRVQPES